MNVNQHTLSSNVKFRSIGFHATSDLRKQVQGIFKRMYETLKLVAILLSGQLLAMAMDGFQMFPSNLSFCLSQMQISQLTEPLTE